MTFQTKFKIDDLMGKQKDIGWTKSNITLKTEGNAKPKGLRYEQIIDEHADEILRERVRAMDEHEKSVVYDELCRSMPSIVHNR